MLSQKYKYTFFDVETTWLNANQDHIIQIWLIQVDANFQIIKKFESYIKPIVGIEKLKSIVWFITNIDINTLAEAPDFDEVKHEVMSFFGEDVIVIWHNIEFDIWFLRKYMPTIFCKYIDTLSLSRNLLHYLPSYSQESIHNYLNNSVSIYRQYISDIIPIIEEKHHDAMYDTSINLAIFHYLVDQIHSLTLSYPWIVNHFCIDEFWSTFGEWHNIDISYHIPHFNKIFSPKSNNSWEPICNLTKQDFFKKIYMWNVDLEFFILDIIKNDKIILATNSNSKLQIIKTILINNNIKGFGFLKPGQTIDNDLLDNWIKTKLDTAEIGFLLKYISHHKAWLSVLDLNSESDYQIYNLIRKDSQISSENIILTTHAWLFANIENDMLSDYTIIFMDNDWRYSSMLKYISKPIDIMNMVYIIDNIRYKYHKLFQIQKLKNPNIDKKSNGVVAQINIIYDRFLVFFANINIEMKHYLTNIRHDDDGRYKIQQIWNNNSDFQTSKKLFVEIIDKIEILSEYSDFLWKDYDLLAEQILKIQNIFTKFTTVSLKTDYQWYRQYIYLNNNNYLTYDEFKDFFKKNKVVFFTIYDQIGQNIYTNNIPSQQKYPISIPQIHNITTFENFIKNTDGTYIYIYSNSKNKSKSYFDEIIKNQINKEYDIHVENITGGFGKILWLISDKPFILIWWYELFMWARAKWINISDIYIIWSLWLLHNQIINDMKYWKL